MHGIAANCRRLSLLAFTLAVGFSALNATFMPRVTYAPGCGGRKVSLAGSSAVINYPASNDKSVKALNKGATVVYPNLDSCFWLYSTRGTVVRITFEKFDVEWSPGCIKDRLEVYQGSIEDRASMLSVFCGTLGNDAGRSQDFLTPDGNLLLKFTSDAPYVRTGFKLKLDVVSYVRDDGTPGAPVPPINVPPPRPIEPDSLFPTESQQQRAKSIASWPQTVVSASRPTPKCNGRLDMLQGSAANGTITSPNYGYGSYYASDKCYWLVAAPPNKRILLIFNKFHVGESSAVCAGDSLQVFSGVSSGSGLLGKYCGSTKPPPLTTPGRLALLVFNSDAFLEDGGFDITYCAVDAPSTGPNSPLNTLPIDKQEILGKMRVEVDAPGSSDLIPGTIDTRCDGRVMVLRADASIRTIRSPNFANGKYFSNDNCTWRIWTDPGLTIRVTVSSMSVEAPAPGVRDPKSDPCPYDHVDIFDGIAINTDSLVGHLCGSSENVGKHYFSRTSRLVVNFQTDGTNEFGGFVLSYQVQDKSAAPAILAPSIGQGPKSGPHRCDGQTKIIKAIDTEQYLTSPNYGSALYAPNDRCNWIIRADAGKVVQLYIIDMELDGALPTCNGDVVKIYDGQIDISQQNYHHLIETICGPHRLLPRRTLLTLKNGATVTFKTDGSMEYIGFRISFKQTGPEGDLIPPEAPLTNFMAPSPCHGKINTLVAVEEVRSLTSPNYGVGAVADTCAWLITTNAEVRANERIHIVIDDFQVGPTGPDHSCTANYVQVFDGASPAAPEMGRFCGNYYYEQIISSGSSLYIQFCAGTSSKGRGFKISFKAASNALHRLALAHTSPKSPSTTAAPVKKCNGMGYQVQANDKEWQTIGMPDVNSSMVQYAPDDACKWKITAPIGFVLRFKFDSFHLESPLSRSQALSPSAGDDCPDFVDIYNGEDETEVNATRVGRFCGNTPPEAQLGLTELTTTGRFAVIRFFSDSNNEWSGFRMKYKAVRVPGTPTGPQPNPNFQLQGRCNGRVFPISATETVQILHSPNFDFGGYQAGDTCTWVLVAPRKDQRLQLVFTIMDVPSDDNQCLGSYVSLRDGSSESDRLLGQFCSGNYPDRRPIYSTSQVVTVHFKSDWRNWLNAAHGKGFQLGFNYV